jgi:hypothetical protein
MAYSDLAQVQAEFKDITFDVNTPVTPAEVDRFLEEASAYINSRLGLLYQTPVLGTQAAIVLRTIETYLVKSRILSIMKVKAGIGVAEQESDDPGSQGLRMLDEIISGKLTLTDAQILTGAAGVRSYSYENDIPHVFDVTKTQW